MSYFNKNWKVREFLFPKKFTALGFDHSPIIKKVRQKERKEVKKEERKRERAKVQVNFKLNNYNSNE